MIIEQEEKKGIEKPELDTDRDYEARLLGIAHVGKHEKNVYGKNGKPTGETKEVDQAILIFELVEEDTYLEIGPDDSKELKPRTETKFENYSSNEKSNLFKLAKSIDPKAAYTEGKKSFVDTSRIVGKPVMLRFKEKDGEYQNIAEIKAVPAKFQDAIGEAQNPLFQFSCMQGAFPLADKTETTIDDVPLWIIKFALDKALNIDESKILEQLEEHVEAAEADHGSMTNSDDMKVKNKQESADKDDKEDKQDEPEEKDEKSEKSGSSSRRRGRRGSGSGDKDKRAELLALSIEDLEDKFVDAGNSEDKLDELADEHPEDEAFKAAIVDLLLA